LQWSGIVWLLCVIYNPGLIRDDVAGCGNSSLPPISGSS
jgi:hypothetical protein